MRTIDLSGKDALVLGVANQRSLAWAIAESLGQAGARLAFTYQGDRIKDNVTALAASYPGSPHHRYEEGQSGLIGRYANGIGFAPRRVPANAVPSNSGP